MSKFEELREQYKEFVYKGYEVELGDKCHIRYEFEIPGLAVFYPEWEFPVMRNVDKKLLERLVFNLGMVECISYYKCTCPKKVKVLCGKLSKENKLWWKKLFYNGLGEFMYINGIDISEDELLTIEADEEYEEPYKDTRKYEGCLVPVGGGKDSVVSLELLKNEKVLTYHINYGSAIREVIDAYDSKEGDYYAVRTLSPRMLELNREGYLNGHTPFSAIVAFSSVIAAYLSGRKYIVLSNETSANETTVKDSFVNHQYSKSFEFEEDFADYFKGITDSDIHYFSLLRPLAEIQIAALFSKYNEFHHIFRSCNAGSKKGIWCCNCPKCLFVYIILLPFIPENELIGIFGEKLLDKESLDSDFRKLTGIEENKPFECVGTRKEVLVALKEFILKGGRSLLTDRYRDVILNEKDTLEHMLSGWVSENNVPLEYQNILKESLEN